MLTPADDASACAESFAAGVSMAPGKVSRTQALLNIGNASNLFPSTFASSALSQSRSIAA